MSPAGRCHATQLDRALLHLACAGTGIHNFRNLRNVKADGEQHVAVDLAEVFARLTKGTAVELVVGTVSALLSRSTGI